MFFVYAIKSEIKNYTHVGFTDDLSRRFNQHNIGYEKSTKAYKPFRVIYCEKYHTRSLARQREKFLKSGKGCEFLKQFK
jgi:putative endonuclease